MDPNFQLCVERVFRHEGGFSDNPSDPGGKTMFGITEQVARKNGYKGEMRFLPREMALSILEREYWTPIRGSELPLPLAFQLFDFAVNSGPPVAVKFLQRVLGTVPDSIFGPLTMGKIRELGEGKPLSQVCFELIDLRRQFQQSLITWGTFGKGWTARNFQNISFLLKDLHVL
jgi:lysozyme family protein